MKKTVDELDEKDFRKFPVWEFCNDDSPAETAMSPVESIPVDHLRGRVVACDLSLANGKTVFGDLSNLNVRSARRTQEFLLLSVYNKGKRFHLARYFDNDERHGPTQFAAFLELTVSEVFPISYDVGHLVNAPSEIVRGLVWAEPQQKLSLSERRALE